MSTNEYHETNRLSWNEATKAHNSHKGNQAAYFRDGGSTLFPEEIELLGDIHGKTLVHLQCNSGQDTISIVSRLGATAHGVDISDEAITFARQLSADSGISASFERSDIFDWFAHNTTQYDLAFSSYGALTWLSDLKAWGKGIAKALKPNGRFVIVEFHPVYAMFEDGWTLTYDYMGGKHIQFDGVGDYVALTGSTPEVETLLEGEKDFRNPHSSHEFCWGLSDILSALLDAGLQLQIFREYPYSNGFKRFGDMVETPGRRFAMPTGMPITPLMFGLVAQKPTA